MKFGVIANGVLVQKLNPNSALFRIKIGCYHEAFIKASQTNNPAEVLSFRSSKLSLVYAKTPANLQIQFLMSNYLEFVTDTVKCSFHRITQYSDSKYESKIDPADSAKVRFSANPLERSLTDGLVDETIKYPNGPSAFKNQSSVFLKVDTLGIENREFVSTNYEIEINICDDQPQLVILSDRINLDISKNQPHPFTGYLLNVFKYTVSYLQCSGYEYIISSTSNPSGVTSKAGVSITGDILTITTANPQYDFYVIMRGTQSQNTIAVQYHVRIIDCYNFLVTPKQPNLSFYKQKFT